MSLTQSPSDGIRKKSKTDVSDTVHLTIDSFSKLPIELVFSNSMVAQQIFSNLDYCNLISCRLVCHQWNKVVTPVFSTKIFLNLNKLFNEPKESILHIPSIKQPELVRHVEITFDKAEDEVPIPLDVGLSRPLQLAAFCEKYKDQIRGLRVKDSDGNDLIRPLRTIFNLCKQLEELSLLQYGNEEEDEDEIVDSEGLISESLNLKKLKLETRCNNLPSHLDRFLYNIIEASHNLINLDLDGNLYPDLSCNSNLKTLSVCEYYEIEYDEMGKELERIIKEVAGSLEELTLDAIDFNLPSKVTNFLTLPHMPNLKVFVNKAIHIYPLKSFDSLGKCPNLTEIELFGPYLEGCNMEYILKNFHSPRNSKVFKSVTKLEVVQFKNVSAIESLVSFFPCISILKFEFGISNVDDDRTNMEIQNQTKLMFEALAKLTKLKDLEIYLYWYCELKTLVDAISENSELFAGLKRLFIYNGGYLNSQKDCDLYVSFDKLQPALLLTKDISECCLFGFHMELISGAETFKFIADENLPIAFPLKNSYQYVCSREKYEMES